MYKTNIARSIFETINEFWIFDGKWKGDRLASRCILSPFNGEKILCNRFLCNAIDNLMECYCLQSSIVYDIPDKSNNRRPPLRSLESHIRKSTTTHLIVKTYYIQY